MYTEVEMRFTKYTLVLKNASWEIWKDERIIAMQLSFNFLILAFHSHFLSSGTISKKIPK